MTCQDCDYFEQHYTCYGGRYSKVRCGHCMYSLRMSANPDRPSCKHFLPRAEKACEFLDGITSVTTPGL